LPCNGAPARRSARRHASGKEGNKTGLSAIGITVERANAVAHVLGFDDCGCESRKAWLDALGKRVGIG
jgi:hypothetical protein